MLKVEDYEKIRKAVIREGMSIREASRQFGHGRDTIRKALQHSLPPGYRRQKEVECPVIGPFKHIIDAWLEEEKARGVNRKQRFNANKIWEKLCSEHDFPGSVYPVRRYIRDRKLFSGQKAFFPLTFAPGEEGQVDWGEAHIQLGNSLISVHFFCMRLCYSRGTYARAYFSEKLECFLDGHVRAFNFLGGSARTNAYDNLKSAVLSRGKSGDRRLNEMFVALRSHYLFDSRFCNVGSGNEKGRVENLVKLVQRDFLAGAPSFRDLDELNAWLEKCCLKNLERKAPHSERTRAELLEEERSYLLPLPSSDFEACVARSTFISKLALVQHETNFYSVPVSKIHHRVTLKAFAERIEIYCDNRSLATHSRSWKRHQFILDYIHYIKLLKIKPGGLKNALPFKKEFLGRDMDKMRLELQYRYADSGVRQFIDLLFLFDKYPAQQVKEAVRQCISKRAFSVEAVKGVIEYQPPVHIGEIDLSKYPDFQVETDGVRDSKEYDIALLNKESIA